MVLREPVEVSIQVLRNRLMFDFLQESRKLAEDVAYILEAHICHEQYVALLLKIHAALLEILAAGQPGGREMNA